MNNSTGCSANATVCNGTSCVVTSGNFNAILSVVLSTILTILLALVMFSMGCNVEIKKFLGHIRRPWGICVGFLCQFGIMPLTGFILSVAFGILPIQAVVVLITGCCPGGTASNILAYWVDGDMDLSVSMTTCSTLLALGMMPLCLFTYTKMWVESGTIVIPYNNIGTSLVTLVVPVSIGMFVNHKWPQKAKLILKIGSITGAILIVVTAVVGGILYQSAWIIAPKLWIIGMIFPVAGYSLGFFLARIAGQPWHRCRTVALETGMQNTQLCSTIVQLSFTQEQLNYIFTFPLIYSIFQLVFAAVFLGRRHINLLGTMYCVFSSMLPGTLDCSIGYSTRLWVLIIFCTTVLNVILGAEFSFLVEDSLDPQETFCQFIAAAGHRVYFGYKKYYRKNNEKFPENKDNEKVPESSLHKVNEGFQLDEK